MESGGTAGVPGPVSSHRGVRCDGADTPESGDKPSSGYPDGPGVEGWASRPSPGVRIFFFHGSLSRRTRFPALRELYSGALGRFLPNPDLKPEVLTGGEIGFTFMREKLDLQAVGFYQVLADGIVRSSVVTEDGKKYKTDQPGPGPQYGPGDSGLRKNRGLGVVRGFDPSKNPGCRPGWRRGPAGIRAGDRWKALGIGSSAYGF